MKQEPQFKTPTKVCKVCFKEIKDGSYHSILNEGAICYSCLNEMHPEFIEFQIDDIEALSLYEYDGVIKERIYQYKGCGDFELNNIFVGPFVNELRFLYHNYEIVVAPSHNVEKMGNHVIFMFQCLGLTIHDIFLKTEPIKQSDQSYFARKEICKYIKFKDDLPNLEGKNLLLVDDICTTGSTLKSCIKLLKELNPKKIKILVIAKRVFSEEEKAELARNSNGRELEII